MAKLTDWEIVKTPKGHRLHGNIYDDEKERFKDGQEVWTSRIKSIDFENKVAETKNTKYELIGGGK